MAALVLICIAILCTLNEIHTKEIPHKDLVHEPLDGDAVLIQQAERTKHSYDDLDLTPLLPLIEKLLRKQNLKIQELLEKNVLDGLSDRDNKDAENFLIPLERLKVMAEHHVLDERSVLRELLNQEHLLNEFIENNRNRKKVSEISQSMDDSIRKEESKIEKHHSENKHVLNINNNNNADNEILYDNDEHDLESSHNKEQENSLTDVHKIDKSIQNNNEYENLENSSNSEYDSHENQSDQTLETDQYSIGSDELDQESSQQISHSKRLNNNKQLIDNQQLHYDHYTQTDEALYNEHKKLEQLSNGEKYLYEEDNVHENEPGHRGIESLELQHVLPHKMSYTVSDLTHNGNSQLQYLHNQQERKWTSEQQSEQRNQETLSHSLQDSYESHKQEREDYRVESQDSHNSHENQFHIHGYKQHTHKNNKHKKVVPFTNPAKDLNMEHDENKQILKNSVIKTHFLYQDSSQKTPQKEHLDTHNLHNKHTQSKHVDEAADSEENIENRRLGGKIMRYAYVQRHDGSRDNNVFTEELGKHYLEDRKYISVKVSDPHAKGEHTHKSYNFSFVINK